MPFSSVIPVTPLIVIISPSVSPCSMLVALRKFVPGTNAMSLIPSSTVVSPEPSSMSKSCVSAPSITSLPVSSICATSFGRFALSLIASTIAVDVCNSVPDVKPINVSRSTLVLV